MEVAGTSETSETIYKITQRHVSEHRKLIANFITQTTINLLVLN
jgi:precorrin-6B methylase 2